MDDALPTSAIDSPAEDLVLCSELPPQMERFPRFRYMGSKFRLLQWISDTVGPLPFDSAIDAFSGSGVVSYWLKSMGKQVVANDSLSFPNILVSATVANNSTRLDDGDLERLLSAKAKRERERFVQTTFAGIFYSAADLEFIDDLWCGIRTLDDESKRSVAIAALLRSCIKRQPRGLFTVAGDPERYKDGRRDLRLSIRDHFVEQVSIYNQAVFDNGRPNKATMGSALELDPDCDLAYFDPPYVPRSDDNCYVKRYHFLEGLSRYWEGMEIMEDSKVKKLRKPFTPFSYRRTAEDAFDQLFRHFADSIQVLSYSSNAYPDLETLVGLMRKYKPSVEVVERSHRYHFGTHQAAKRNVVREYLIIGGS